MMRFVWVRSRLEAMMTASLTSHETGENPGEPSGWEGPV